MRRFNIGDKIRCTESGVRGICVKFYTPTACEEQTMVEYSNGERTAAPARTRDGKWRCDCIIGGNGKVIAWMPLPEPYKGE